MFRTSRHRTLVDLLERNIGRADGRGPDWPLEVVAAVSAQDMEYELEVWRQANESVAA